MKYHPFIIAAALFSGCATISDNPAAQIALSRAGSTYLAAKYVSSHPEDRKRVQTAATLLRAAGGNYDAVTLRTELIKMDSSPEWAALVDMVISLVPEPGPARPSFITAIADGLQSGSLPPPTSSK